MVQVGIAIFVLMKNRNEGRDVAWVSGFSECNGSVHSGVKILVCKEIGQGSAEWFGIRLSECLRSLSSNSPTFIGAKIIQEDLRFLVLLKAGELTEPPKSMKTREKVICRGCCFRKKVAIPIIFCESELSALSDTVIRVLEELGKLFGREFFKPVSKK